MGHPTLRTNQDAAMICFVGKRSLVARAALALADEAQNAGNRLGCCEKEADVDDVLVGVVNQLV